MGRILFVTVGTSAITNRELWEHNGDLADALPPEGNWGESIRLSEARAVDTFTRRGKVDWPKVEEQVKAAHPGFEAALTDLHRHFWDRSHNHRRTHLKRTSAESISTWLAGVAHRMDGGPLEAGEDKVVLLVSRTCIGQMAGRINEAVFREFLFTGADSCDIWTEPIDDLRLEGIHAEGGEAKSLSAQVRRLYERHSDRRTAIFNITGGFKGLIPVITAICIPENRTMFYLHESMKDAVRIRFENGREQEDHFEAFDIGEGQQ